jgi:hypothetical protein
MSFLLAALAVTSLSPDSGMAVGSIPTAMTEQASSRRYDGWDDRGRYGRRAAVYTFDAPELDGYPLDICPRDVGADGLLRGRCGIPVANDFCRAQGFDEASDAPHDGGQGPTRQLSGAIVSHPWATTFRYITCVR